MSIPIFYYDKDSKRYHTFYEFMVAVRQRVCAELISVLSCSKMLEDSATKKAEMLERAQCTLMGSVPAVDAVKTTLFAKICNAKDEKKPRDAAVYRQRYRRHVNGNHLPETSECYVLSERGYIDTLEDGKEMHRTPTKQSKEVLRPSESVSFYSNMNTEYKIPMLLYDNQQPPDVLDTTGNSTIWKRREKKKIRSSSVQQTIPKYIPCDPCRQVFKTYEEYQKHLVARAHALHVEIAKEEAKFLKPLPLIDNASWGYTTTSPTTLNINDLWKPEYAKYQCLLCEVEVPSRGHLLAHYRKSQHISRVENGTQMIRKCDTCGFKSQKSVERSDHEMSEIHKKAIQDFTCQICLTIHYGHKAYSYHVSQCTKRAWSEKCPLVSFLQQNLQTGLDLTCFICKKQYNSYKTFVNHLNSSDSHKTQMSAFQKNSNKCIGCNKVFYRLAEFESHLCDSPPCAVVASAYRVQTQATLSFLTSSSSSSSSSSSPSSSSSSLSSSSLSSSSSPSSSSSSLSSSSSPSSSSSSSSSSLASSSSPSSSSSSSYSSSSSSLSSSLSSSSSMTVDEIEVAGTLETLAAQQPPNSSNAIIPSITSRSHLEDSKYRIYLNKAFVFCAAIYDLYEPNINNDMYTPYIRALDSETEDMSSYLTLYAIKSCLSDEYTRFIISDDKTSGLLYCDYKQKRGVVGHFGKDINPLLRRLIRKSGSTFHYFPEYLIGALKQVLSEDNLHIQVNALDENNPVNSLFALYFKVTSYSIRPCE